MAFKKMYSVVAVVSIVGASTLAWWLQAPKPDAGAAAGVRPMGVEISQVKKQTLRDDADAVGTLRSSQNVMLRPEIAGRVLSLGFADGARVRAGQVLVQMDDTLQRAEVQQSLAQMSVARANHKRNQELVAQSFIAQRSLDESAAALQVADAQLGLSCARLERMRLIAPFNGVVGIRSVNVGDYVKDGADLINLENIGSLYVDYRLPERYQTKVMPGQTIEVKIDAFSGRMFKAKVEAVDPLIDANGRSIGVRAVLANTSGEPILGGGGKASAAQAANVPAAPASAPVLAAKSAASAPMVASALNRGVALPSPQSMGCPSNMFDRTRTSSGGEQNGPLRPGMFARVTAVFAVKPNALVVPEEAIVPQGSKQFVIKAVDPSELPAPAASAAASAPALPPDTKLVSQRVEVKLGIRRGGQVEITDGLAEGDTIVVAGQQRLQKDGSPLRVVELGRGSANAASAAASGNASSAASANSPASAATQAASR
ncbi:efflux RND transporter periplasmic adaptor subunit [Limnohabitans sp.]|uniref:efflux RND transporter periplasmic adaptor subunit n=1 Tax=Limnohabitans sp. TaxID=1907725 RepID=UPI00286F29F3|nr:efflux RND transporter periplasmic adaptor subunit [Limnohabitans sp.]